MDKSKLSNKINSLNFSYSAMFFLGWIGNLIRMVVIEHSAINSVTLAGAAGASTFPLLVAFVVTLIRKKKQTVPDESDLIPGAWFTWALVILLAMYGATTDV